MTLHHRTLRVTVDEPMLSALERLAVAEGETIQTVARRVLRRYALPYAAMLPPLTCGSIQGQKAKK